MIHRIAQATAGLRMVGLICAKNQMYALHLTQEKIALSLRSEETKKARLPGCYRTCRPPNPTACLEQPSL